MTILLSRVRPEEPAHLAVGESVLGQLGVHAKSLDFPHPTLSIDMDVLPAASAIDALTAPDFTAKVLQFKTNLPCTHVHVPLAQGKLQIAQTTAHLFGVLEMPDAQDIQTASYHAYQALLASCKNASKNHLLRIWNYMPQINAVQSDVGQAGQAQERYHLFNTARRKALLEANYSIENSVPAACALGSHRGGLGIAFLASSSPSVAIENPRQVSAYNYPKDYGVNPPIFARATWFRQAQGKDLLFISGTASIVGHQTLHAGDIVAQTNETIANIQAVLQEANRKAGSQVWTLSQLHGQVYVRNPMDISIIQSVLKQQQLLDFSCVHADICRSDLLIEIEAYAQL